MRHNYFTVVKSPDGDDFIFGSVYPSGDSVNYPIRDVASLMGTFQKVLGQKYLYKFEKTVDYPAVQTARFSTNNADQSNVLLSGITNIYINIENNEGVDITDFLQSLSTFEQGIAIHSSVDATQYAAFRIVSATLLTSDVLNLSLNVLSSSGSISANDDVILYPIFGVAASGGGGGSVDVDGNVVDVQLKRNTSISLAISNPLLLSGEKIIETDTGKSKVGDGNTNWNDLPYATGFQDQLQVIDGWFTKKKANPTTLISHEIGDFVFGWAGGSFLAGRINSLPLVNAANLDIAVNGTISNF